MRFLHFLGKSIVIIFALVGLAFASVFVGIRFGWTNVRGSVDDRSSFFASAVSAGNAISSGQIDKIMNESQILCSIRALAKYAPDTANDIQYAWQSKQDLALVQGMLSSAMARFVNNTNIASDYRTCASVTDGGQITDTKTSYAWAESEEWAVMQAAFVRDQDTINRAAHDAGISPRLLLGGVIGEQFRFFTSKRDSFKQYFEPLKVLASLSSFSYGIAGLKPETVKQIDENLKNQNSPFYLGPDAESIITYPAGADQDALRFSRITDTNDAYYSYLYVGLFMRQVMQQWKNAGYDISNRPDVLATLYNLGFNRSIPKADAKAGGALITVNNQEYTFGGLGYEFYYSGELQEAFPY